MKKLFAILTIVGFVFFTACGSSSTKEVSSEVVEKTECQKKCSDSEKSGECKSQKECCGKAEKECCKSKTEGEEVKTQPAS